MTNLEWVSISNEKNRIFVKFDKICGPTSSFLSSQLNRSYIFGIREARAILCNRKIQFVTENFPTFFTFPKLWAAAAHLILGAFWKKLMYLESGKHNPQHGSGIFEFRDILFWTWLVSTKELCMVYGNSQKQ